MSYGIRGVLTSLLSDRRFGFDVERAIYMTVLHRLMISGSDQHASDWSEHTDSGFLSFNRLPPEERPQHS
ncbi:MAG: hypothetical protein H7840_12700 [Alphaproteobacteria bacterium]